MSILYFNKSHFDLIMGFESIEDARNWFIQLFKQLFSAMDSSVASYDSPYIQDISLNSVAEQVEISSVCLSKLFKEQVGAGLSEFLNDIRLKKTISLLAEGSHEPLNSFWNS
jgi:two-component system response regulator YesN